MKRNILILTLLLTGCVSTYAQKNTSDSVVKVSGTVTDGHEAVVGANVFVKGTIDGCLTDSLGRFSFTTTSADSAVLMVTCMGYDDCRRVLAKR